MREKEPTREPFELKEGSVDEGVSSIIKEPESHPDKLVKQEDLIRDSVDESIAYFSAMRGMLDRMKSNYGINIPDTGFAIGEVEKGESKVFIVTEKIEGKDLKELQNIPEGQQGKFETFYASILQSMFDAYREKKPFYADLHLGNIMYGHQFGHNTEEDTFFLVDAGNMAMEDKYPRRFIGIIIEAAVSFNQYERKFGKDTKLNLVRGKFNEIYDYLRADTGTQEKRALTHALSKYVEMPSAVSESDTEKEFLSLIQPSQPKNES